MAKRIVTKIGNIFCVEIDKQYKKFFQYVANDMSMLNSSVIRAFKRKYTIEWKPNMDVIVDDDVEFYAHTILSVGIHNNTWYKAGTHKDVGDTTNIMFRYYSEGNTSHMTKSYRWYIWRINQEHIKIGEMTDEYKHLDIGPVFPYFDIKNKIKTGKYIYHILE
ncbi:hypothetical protein HPS54_11385 [Prevotella sp. PCHR]|uniref:Uncharacterized protein n=1 Tax=Xylanibacter caecicola TaxID=2736294 RepID=A0ABX2B565_9BACT|nr:hypothetical protein [Xylanibacter caecicola]NPE26102.1 hypothetical protein [Xylanibacter caecicola]